jgi:hypothetical protein
MRRGRALQRVDHHHDSIRLSLVGAHVDCRMKNVAAANILEQSTITSPSENRRQRNGPKLMFKCRHTASASFGFALPVKIRIRSKAMEKARRFLNRVAVSKKRSRV